MLRMGKVFLIKWTTQEIFVERSLTMGWDEDVETGGRSQEPLWEARGTDGDEEEHAAARVSHICRFCSAATELISYWVLSGKTFLQLGQTTLSSTVIFS